MRRFAPLLLASLALAAPSAAAAAAAEPTTLSVTGRGSVDVAPDQATIALTVRKVSPTQEAARRTVNRRTSQVIAGVVRAGVGRDEIQSSGIALDQQRLRPTRKGGRVRIRFVATNALTVRTKRLELVGRIFDVATAVRVTEFRGPEFAVVDRTPGRAEATTAAVADARARADAAAAALGLRVVGVQSVSLDPEAAPSSSPDSSSLPTSTAAPGTSTPTPVAPGTEAIAAVARVTFLLG